MSYKIILTPNAVRDINEAVSYYQEKASKKVANLFIEDYRNTFRKIQETKYFKTFFENFRGKSMNKFPYIIFYTIDENQKIIMIKAVFHASQNTDKYPEK